MRKRATLWLIVAGVLACANVAPPAIAQNRDSDDDQDTVAPLRPGRQNRANEGAGEQCIKLCARDLSPCDPFEFKRSDGRCGGGMGGVP